MKHLQANELLECPDCGARIGIGKYERLSRWGREGCRSDPVNVPAAEADRLLSAEDNRPVKIGDCGDKR